MEPNEPATCSIPAYLLNIPGNLKSNYTLLLRQTKIDLRIKLNRAVTGGKIIAVESVVSS